MQVQPDEHGRRDVLEAGPIPIWQRFENTHDEWETLGRPGWDRLGLTVTPDGRHRVWLDEPHGPHARAGAVSVTMLGGVRPCREGTRHGRTHGTLVPTPGQPDPELIPSLLAASDVLGTGWFAAVAAEAGPGKTVAVVGDGAVGLMGVLAAKQLEHRTGQKGLSTPRARRDRHQLRRIRNARRTRPVHRHVQRGRRHPPPPTSWPCWRAGPPPNSSTRSIEHPVPIGEPTMCHQAS